MKKTFILLVRMLARVLFFFYLPFVALLVFAFYPYNTDPPSEASIACKSAAYIFYDSVYDTAKQNDVAIAEESNYVDTARNAAKRIEIESYVRKVVEAHNLQRKKVLEVGSGIGLLQDIVNDYTGLDIASSAARYYHKPFVAASADSIPFTDNMFDAVWCIWVLEHVRDPERVLMEMRRVLKPKGILLLKPAWNCSPWASQGYETRPYSHFGIYGKTIKASIPIVKLGAAIAQGPVRFCRRIHYKIFGKKTILRFRALTPNYDTYLGPDSDAAISIDSFEVTLWFQSRGDQCLDSGNLFLINK